MPDPIVTNAQPASTSGSPTPPLPSGAATPQAGQLDPAAIKQQREAEQIRQRGIAIKAQREKEMSGLRSEVERLRARAAKAEEYESRERNAALDPDAFLKPALGDKWYEALTKAKLGDDSNLQIRSLRDELRGEIEKERTANKDRDTQQQARLDAERARVSEEERQYVEEFKLETGEFLKANAEKFELVSALELAPTIADRIKSHFDQTGRVLSHEEAAGNLEKELDALIEKVLLTKKYQARLQPKRPEAERSAFELSRSSRRSIGNDMAPSTQPETTKFLTREQKLQRAIASLDNYQPK